eukprot:GHRQ01023634.1.p1 GENE.GHRQ01023634.1~~GHRQ01023634.1.p1  ORF type:complete len:165 (+),score=65.10 GHRQ01023634.1:152-646(+)
MNCLGGRRLEGLQQQALHTSTPAVAPCMHQAHRARHHRSRLQPAAALQPRPAVFSQASAAAAAASKTSRPSAAAAAGRSRGWSVIVRAGQDFYDVLGVPRTADKKQIKQAYRQKARKFHPDVNKDAGAEDTFKAIGEAYEVRVYSSSIEQPAWHVALCAAATAV